MPTYQGVKIKTTRSTSSVGPVIIVHVPGVSRIAQVYTRENATGMIEFYAWVSTILGPSIRPEYELVPEKGGCATMEDLEENIVMRRK